jgi:hypothetical protein
MKMRWRAGLVPVILMAAATLTLPGPSSAGGTGLTAMKAGTRAMWLWSDAPPADVVGWATAKGVSEIFVNVSPTALTNGDLGRLQELKRRADAGRIRLTALGGDPGWTTDHAAALAWQKTVVTTGIFAGIHLDVEPYLTNGWTNDQQATAKSYLTLLDSLRAGSTLQIDADVPFWLGQFKIGKNNLADEVLTRVNAVTVMSYRDTATGTNSMLSVSLDWLNRGATAGKRVRLGAETGPLPDCTYCTFAEEGSKRLDQELAKVDGATRQSAAFGGIAVHRYSAWRALPA